MGVCVSKLVRVLMGVLVMYVVCVWDVYLNMKMYYRMC